MAKLARPGNQEKRKLSQPGYSSLKKIKINKNNKKKLHTWDYKVTLQVLGNSHIPMHFNPSPVKPSEQRHL